MSAIKKVTARFWVTAITRRPPFVNPSQTNGWATPAPLIDVKMQVVSGGRAPENAAWASATPSGEITMTIGNPEAAAWFDSMLGKDVAITFEARDDLPEGSQE